MGLKTSFRCRYCFFIVFLLLGQFFFIGVVSSKNTTQLISQNLTTNPIDRFESLLPNDHGTPCVDLLVVDDLVIVETWYDIDYLDISTPSNPEEIAIDSVVYSGSTAYTNYENIILFGLINEGIYNNYSIMKIDLEVNTTSYTKIGFSNIWLRQMLLTNDTLYSFGNNNYGQYSFLIHNSIIINDLSLIGNTTLIGIDYESSFIVHDNFVYFTSDQDNLLVYQINSSSHLEFIREYTFSQLEGVYFYGGYLFTCDNFGLQIFDYFDPSNLIYLAHYNTSFAQSITIRDDIAYLTSSNSFTLLNLSNLTEIVLLDQYIPGDREYVEMWKVELSGNLAIILTKEDWALDARNRYGGYLYIFDITSPTKIQRLYPDRIPLLDPWGVVSFLQISAIVIAGIIVVVLISLLIRFIVRKKKHKEKMDLTDPNT